jgi:hypothetical protein
MTADRPAHGFTRPAHGFTRPVRGAVTAAVWSSATATGLPPVGWDAGRGELTITLPDTPAACLVRIME